MMAGPAVIGQVVPRAPGGGIAFPPPGGFGLKGPFVWDAESARRIPTVSRCLQLFAGMTKQMQLDRYRGSVQIPRGMLLERPDPTRARSWFVQISIEDYLLNGNAVSYITSRGFDGWPTSAAWLPASWVYISWQPMQPTADVDYWYLGTRLDPVNVVHVRRGADRYYPVRGVGIVEEALGTLDRVAMEEAYEASALSSGAVPSVAVITPQATLTTDVANEAKESWVDKFGGPTREPAILPNGTQVVPLSWSPTDTQMIEARKMSLLDVANIFNLDGYWVGSPVAGMTYKTASPQYQQILRTSIEPVLADFEDVWSHDWLPRGQVLRFDRKQLLREDLATTMTAMVQGTGAGIVTTEEARETLGLPIEPLPGMGELDAAQPGTAPEFVSGDPEDDPDNPDDTGEEDTNP
jgi:HK97 family phage portal protein